MRNLPKLAVLAMVAGTTHAASAQPPGQGQGMSQAAAQNSAVQQALANRQQVLNRLTSRASDNGTANRAQGLLRATAGAGNAAATAARGLDRAGIATGTGRLGSDVLRGLRSGAAPRRIGLDRAEFVRGQRVSRLERVRSERRDRSEGTPADAEATTGRRNELVSGGLNRRAMTQADRLLAKRLADIDHLRDQALRNGNVRLLEQADRLEALARQQYDRRVNGTKLNAPAIFRRNTPAEDRPAERTTRRRKIDRGPRTIRKFQDRDER